MAKPSTASRPYSAAAALVERGARPARRAEPPACAPRHLAVGLAILAIALAGNQASANPVGDEVSATDSHGTLVRLAQPARRVVTLAPHATELVAAAGGLPYLAGTVRGSDHPAAALAVPLVGDAWNLDRERLAATAPDLLVGWMNAPVSSLQPLLGALRLPVFYSAPSRLDEIPGQIEALGTLMGTSDVARPEAERWRERLARLRSAQPQRQPVLDVFLEIGREPLYTLNHEHVANDILALCGGRNLYADAPVVAPQASLEDIVRLRPDVLVITQRPEPAARQASLAAWRQMAPALPAAADPLLIDPDWLVRPGPRLLEGAETLCRELDRRRAALP